MMNELQKGVIDSYVVAFSEWKVNISYSVSDQKVRFAGHSYYIRYVFQSNETMVFINTDDPKYSVNCLDAAVFDTSMAWRGGDICDWVSRVIEDSCLPKCKEK